MNLTRTLTSQCFAGLLLVPVLSLSVHAQKQKSDREFYMLKGAVKSVQTEKANLSNVDGKVVEDNREVTSVESYDGTGNLTKIEKYEDGTPLEIETYFFLDGERVYKTEILRQSKLFGYRGGSTYDPNIKPDPRFTIKFKYKFDALGNRTEKTVITNRGDSTSRHVYKYDARNNLMTDTVYLQIRKSNTTNHTTNYKVDDKGNVVEVSREKDFKITYAYQAFDDKGNWTKRSSKRVSNISGKTFESSAVYYRTIAYYLPARVEAK